MDTRFRGESSGELRTSCPLRHKITVSQVLRSSREWRETIRTNIHRQRDSDFHSGVVPSVERKGTLEVVSRVPRCPCVVYTSTFRRLKRQVDPRLLQTPFLRDPRRPVVGDYSLIRVNVFQLICVQMTSLSSRK